MSYFSKQFTEDLLLPDGSVASSVADVDKYLARSGLAMAGDYSPEYMKNIRYQHPSYSSIQKDYLVINQL